MGVNQTCWARGPGIRGVCEKGFPKMARGVAVLSARPSVVSVEKPVYREGDAPSPTPPPHSSVVGVEIIDF